MGGCQAEGWVEKPLPEVLFVCERDAGRSQIAAALTHHLSNGWVGVRSAGSHPDERIDPVVVQAMTEISVDIALEFPKPLTDEVVRAADVVVTLAAATRARSIPESAIRTGRSRIPPASRSRSCAKSATSSTTTSGTSSRPSFLREISSRFTARSADSRDPGQVGAMNRSLGRRVFAELLGSAFLAAVVVLSAAGNDGA